MSRMCEKTSLWVTSSRSSVKVKVEYQSRSFCINDHCRTLVFHKHILFFDRIESIVGKGENVDYQHFLHFPQCFPLRFVSQDR